MKASYQTILTVLVLICSLQAVSAEREQAEVAAKAIVDYTGKIDGLNIDWSKSIAETAEAARKHAGEKGIFLAFVLKGEQAAIMPPLALLSHGHTHHEAINSTIKNADYEFIWPAAESNPDGSWKVTVFVRPRKFLP
jgi:hypothetical protein